MKDNFKRKLTIHIWLWVKMHISYLCRVPGSFRCMICAAFLFWLQSYNDILLWEITSDQIRNHLSHDKYLTRFERTPLICSPLSSLQMMFLLKGKCCFSWLNTHLHDAWVFDHRAWKKVKAFILRGNHKQNLQHSRSTLYHGKRPYLHMELTPAVSNFFHSAGFLQPTEPGISEALSLYTVGTNIV